MSKNTKGILLRNDDHKLDDVGIHYGAKVAVGGGHRQWLMTPEDQGFAQQHIDVFNFATRPAASGGMENAQLMRARTCGFGYEEVIEGNRHRARHCRTCE